MTVSAAAVSKFVCPASNCHWSTDGEHTFKSHKSGCTYKTQDDHPTEVLVEPNTDACKAVNTEVTIINASDHFLALKVPSDSLTISTIMCTLAVLVLCRRDISLTHCLVDLS